MSISGIGLSTSDNFQFISSITPSNGSATASFTSLGIHKKFLILAGLVQMGSNGDLFTRLNNDSTNGNYYYSNINGGTTSSGFFGGRSTGFRWGRLTADYYEGAMLIENCDTNGIKTVTQSYARKSTEYTISGFQCYLASAPVTQIDLTVSTTYNGSGTYHLYGVK